MSPAILIAALIAGWLTFAAFRIVHASGFYAGKTIRVIVGFAPGGGRLIPYVIDGPSKDPEVKDLPQFTEVIKDADDLAAFKVWKKPKEFERALAMPPNTPKERLTVFRQAYQQTLADSAFLAEAEKSKMLIEPVRGERVEQAVNELLAISPHTRRKLQFLIRKQGKVS